MSDALKDFYFELGQLTQRAQNWKERALAAEQERDRVKAELQQANGFFNVYGRQINHWLGSLRTDLWTHQSQFIFDIARKELRAILERIEKEKSPH